MSKRRINKQQALRIRKAQESYQFDTNDISNTQQDGLIIRCMGKEAYVEASDGAIFLCAIRPNLDFVVAGDKVIWLPSLEGQGVIVSTYPRQSVLAKPTLQGITKPVASNITQLAIVIATEPETSFALLDSYLIMAELLKLHPIIVLNKIDLPCDSLKECLKANYHSLNYPIIMVSQFCKEHMNQLHQALNNHVSVFVGQSGVGKSSIIKSILPNESTIQTGELSQTAKLGRHTTSSSCYYHLNPTAALIDSPGVREFRLWHIEPENIIQGYKEFFPYINQCKYRNCTHIQTSSCALIHAVEAGLVSQLRYDNFVKLSLGTTKNK